MGPFLCQGASKILKEERSIFMFAAQISTVAKVIDDGGSSCSPKQSAEYLTVFNLFSPPPFASSAFNAQPHPLIPAERRSSV